MTVPHRRLMPVLIAAALLAALSARAQFVDWPPTPQQFGIFRFDSTFIMGAHTLLYPDMAKNTFHITFSQEYAKTVDGVRKSMENPTTADQLRERERYLLADSIGFGYIWLVNQLPYYVYESKSKQNWYDIVDGSGVLNLDFKTRLQEDWYPAGIWKLTRSRRGMTIKIKSSLPF